MCQHLKLEGQDPIPDVILSHKLHFYEALIISTELNRLENKEEICVFFDIGFSK
jgi:hypothetical protein